MLKEKESKGTIFIKILIFLIFLLSFLCLTSGCASVDDKKQNLTPSQYRVQFFNEQFSPYTRSK
jgi:uncharacterized protein YceK